MTWQRRCERGGRRDKRLSGSSSSIRKVEACVANFCVQPDEEFSGQGNANNHFRFALSNEPVAEAGEIRVIFPGDVNDEEERIDEMAGRRKSASARAQRNGDVGLGRQRVVMYSRVSSAEQEKEGFSIPAQQKLMRDCAGERNFVIVQEFVDVETAKRAGRTGFEAMMHYVKTRPSVRAILNVQ